MSTELYLNEDCEAFLLRRTCLHAPRSAFLITFLPSDDSIQLLKSACFVIKICSLKQ